LIPSHVLPPFGSGNAGTASGANGQATGVAADPLCSPASLFVSTAADSGRWGVASGTSYFIFFFWLIELKINLNRFQGLSPLGSSGGGMSLSGFGSPSLSQLNQLSNALNNHHHPSTQSGGGGIMSPSSLMNSPGYQTAYPSTTSKW